MLKSISGQIKKTALIFSLAIALLFTVPPVAGAASVTEILLGGAFEYIYLQKTLSNYHYNQNKQILANYKKQYGVDEDARANEQLDTVMTKLIGVIGKQEEIKPEYSWFVNKDTSFNAFCGLGHNVSVNIGLFKYLNYNEDQLAFVLAHEMVHGQKNHSLKSVKKIVPVSVAQSLYMSSNPTYSSYILSSIAGNMAVARYSTLPQEKEADKISYDYAVDAGYNPGAGAAIWARVFAKNGNNAGSFFEKIVNPNDHPTNAQRVAYFSERMTQYSNNKVKVQDKAVYVDGKYWAAPLAADGLLGEERAYLIAGNLASVFHAYPEGKQAYAEDGLVKIDGRIVMTPVEGDLSPGELVSNLNQILGL